MFVHGGQLLRNIARLFVAKGAYAMTIEETAAIAEIINAVAVTLTLLGLIVTIRQNTKSQKAMAVDSLAAAIAAINVPATQSSALGSALSSAVNDWTSATRDERIMAHYFLFSFFKLHESAWYQKKAGILDASQWQGWEKGLRKYYHTKGVREVWWPNRRHAYSAEFQAFLAGTTPPDEIGSLAAIFDHAPARTQP
jgi:hypothetical protein